MKKDLSILGAFLLTLILFSFVSGCKIRHKKLNSSSSMEETKSVSSSKAISTNVDSLAVLTIDSTRNKAQQSKKETNRRTVEITFDLDSSKDFSADTSGKSVLANLVNSALKNAKSLRIKVEEQQSKESQKTESTDNHKSEAKAHIIKAARSDEESSSDQGKKEVENQALVIDSDSTIKRNFGPIWLYVLIASGVVSYGLYRIIK